MKIELEDRTQFLRDLHEANEAIEAAIARGCWCPEVWGYIPLSPTQRDYRERLAD